MRPFLTRRGLMDRDLARPGLMGPGLMGRGLAAVALAVAVVSAAPGHAANIVVNGNFGTETNAGTPPDDWSTSGNAGADQTLPNAGDSWDGFVGDPSGSLYQLLPTPGVTYTLSFAVAADFDAFSDPNTPGFFVCFDPAATSCNATSDLFGGAIDGDLNNFGVYQTFTTTITATAPDMYLSFTGQNGNGGTFYLDDVSVTGAVATPEPSDLLVLATALGLLALARTRRA